MYGDAIEHRDIPTEDGIRFIYNDYANKTKGIAHYKSHQHPDAVQTLLKTLAENRSLTVTQYDHLINYLRQRRELQVKAEIGEEVTPMQIESAVASFSSPSYSNPAPKESLGDMQKRILEALNKKSLTEMIAKKTVEPKPAMTKETREELKASLLKNDAIKQAMATLLKRSN